MLKIDAAEVEEEGNPLTNLFSSPLKLSLIGQKSQLHISIWSRIMSHDHHLSLM